MSPRRRLLLTASVSALAIASMAATALPQPGASAWAPLRFRSVPRQTNYTPIPGGHGVRAEADCAASALVLPLEAIDLDRTPVLRWRWHVEQTLEIEDERIREGDDFAARVYLMFRFEPDRASFFERARQRLGSRLFGTEMPGSVLSFVWTSGEAPGSRWTNPFAAETKMIALARGEASDWRDEAVDVVAEYRRTYAHGPPAPLALGIMTDTDNACQHATARYADFRFTEARR
jgi:hypothetical protein